MQDAGACMPTPYGHTQLEAAADRAALAAIFEAHGHRSEARAALGQALTTFERALGPDHYAVAVTLDHLAAAVARDGAYAEAGALYGRALEIYERTLGRAHPQTAACRANRDKAQGVGDP